MIDVAVDLAVVPEDPAGESDDADIGETARSAEPGHWFAGFN